MCQLFISKDFETSLLTLLGVSLVLWRRKEDNAHSNPLFYGPRPLTSQHLHFQFLIVTLLKIFVRSRRDWKKKCREGSLQIHYRYSWANKILTERSTLRLKVQNHAIILIFFIPKSKPYMPLVKFWKNFAAFPSIFARILKFEHFRSDWAYAEPNFFGEISKNFFFKKFT